MSDLPRTAHTAAQLSRAFDDSFAEPISVDVEPREELLAIRAGDRDLAVRTRDIGGILRCPSLTAMPSGNPALCGLAGVRGSVVAVYSLAALVGGQRSSGGGWIVLCAGDGSAALQFDELAGHARVRTSDIHSSDSTQIVRIEDDQRTLISVPLLLETISRNTSAGDHER